MLSTFVITTVSGLDNKLVNFKFFDRFFSSATFFVFLSACKTGVINLTICFSGFPVFNFNYLKKAYILHLIAHCRIAFRD